MTTTTQPPVIICVFGATGTGKSSFINDASGGSLRVGHGQMSCTAKVETAPRFKLDGREIWLIDTPGFDDSTMSDSDVLAMIGEFMTGLFHHKQLIAGMIYMHRITDNRLGGVARKNFRMFRELCGSDAMKNFIICTNMWPESPNSYLEEREQELVTNSKSFAPAIDKGARVTRYMRHKGQSHAHDIIRMCLANVPMATQYQEEINQGVKLGETSAGRVLNEEMQQLVEVHKRQIAQLIEDHQEAIRKKDEETRREIEAERAEMNEALEKLEQNIHDLNDALANEKLKYNADREQQAQDIQRLQAQVKNLETRLKHETNPEIKEQLEEEHRRATKSMGEMFESLWNSIASVFR